MAWMSELRGRERNVEKDIENIEDNHSENTMPSSEESDLFTYERYKNNLNALEELKSIGEDVSEAFEVLEETWSKSECHPTNILNKLENGSVSISEDYYNEVQESLIAMQSDGHDVNDVLRLLEECWAKTGYYEGLGMEQELEELEKQVILLTGKTLDKGDKTLDEK